MRDVTGTWLGGAVRVGAAFLLAGAGLAATTAVALIAIRGVTATTVVTVAPFLLAPPLAAAAALTLTQGDGRAAALGGGLGSLVGSYLLGGFALGTLVGIGGMGGVTGLVVPLLVAGLPTAVVGAASGYLGAGGDEAPDRETVVETSATSATDTAAESTASATDTAAESTASATASDANEDPTVDEAPFEGLDSEAQPTTVGGAGSDGGPTTEDPSPGAVDMDAWADGEEKSEEVSGLDDLFEKTTDPVAGDGD